MKKPMHILFVLIILMSLISCKRDIDKSPENSFANNTEVRNWFENTFKKTDEGKFLLKQEPSLTNLDWGNAIHNERNGAVLVEIPIIGRPSLLFIPKEKISEKDSIQQNFFKSILIIRKGSETTVVQKQYLPDSSYTKRANLSYSKPKYDLTNFSGGVLYLSPLGKMVAFAEVKKDKSLTFFRVSNNKATAKRSVTPNTNCISFEFQTYKEVCVPMAVNLVFSSGNLVFAQFGGAGCFEVEGAPEQILICDDGSFGGTSCVSNMTCGEIELKTNDPGYPSNPSTPIPWTDTTNCDEGVQNAIVNYIDPFELSGLLPTKISDETINTNTKRTEIQWTLLRKAQNVYGQYDGNVVVFITGIRKKENNVWIWDSLSLKSIRAIGGVINQGGTLGFSNYVLNPSFSSDKSIVNLNFGMDVIYFVNRFACGSNMIYIDPVKINYNNYLNNENTCLPLPSLNANSF